VKVTESFNSRNLPEFLACFPLFLIRHKLFEIMSSFTSIDKPLVTRPLGKNGPQVPRLGLGLMSLSGAFGLSATEKERLAFLDEAYKMGERFWDTCESARFSLIGLLYEELTLASRRVW
jgi:hypothetical protein